MSVSMRESIEKLGKDIGVLKSQMSVSMQEVNEKLGKTSVC